MDEQQHESQNDLLEAIADQNKKMRKKLLIALIVTLIAVLVLVSVLLIVKALQERNNAFSLPDSYFYPTHSGDIFEYDDYLQKRPDVILYCEDIDGRGRSTDSLEDFPPEALYLRDFLQIMMRADVDAYNSCFNEIYYKNHQKQVAFSQQMIYEAEIRYAEEEESNGERTVTYYLCYKLYENDGSLRRDVGSDAMIPMKVVLRVTPTGEISISEWVTTRTK